MEDDRGSGGGGEEERSLTIPTFSHVSSQAQGGSALPPGGCFSPDWEPAGREAHADARWVCLARASRKSSRKARIHDSDLRDPGRNSLSACPREKMERKGELALP